MICEIWKRLKTDYSRKTDHKKGQISAPKSTFGHLKKYFETSSKKDHRVCDGLPLTYFDLPQLSFLLLQLLIFPVQIHRDADHDTQADDDKDDGQNYFTHGRSLLLPILELFPALRAILEVFRRGVAAVVADLRPLALLFLKPLLGASCRILPIRCTVLCTR